MVNDINEVIASLTKIDNASAMIMESTRKEKQAYSKEMKQKTLEFDAKLAAATEEKVAKLKTTLEQENKAKLDDFKNKSDNQIKLMTDSYNKNHTVWVDTIFNNIIKE